MGLGGPTERAALGEDGQSDADEDERQQEMAPPEEHADVRDLARERLAAHPDGDE
jgi:hypothetical protein